MTLYAPISGVLVLLFSNWAVLVVYIKYMFALQSNREQTINGYK